MASGRPLVSVAANLATLSWRVLQGGEACGTQVTSKLHVLLHRGIDGFDADRGRAMIVLGLTASLMASLTLAAFMFLCRIEEARSKATPRVL